MLLYTILNISYFENHSAVNLLRPMFIQTLRKKSLLLFFIILSTFVYSSAALSKNRIAEKATITDEVSNLSDLELYRKSKSIRRSDRKGSIKLAELALQKSQHNKNYRLSAETHTLLGKLARESKQIDQSIHHFLQASLIYKQIGDKRNQIMATVGQANTLIAEKRFEEGDKIIDDLLPIAIEYADDLPIAQIKMTKGDGYFSQKRYKDGIEEYKNALKYLTDEDNEVQKRLALTFQKIARSYAKLKNTDEAINYYKSSLNIYAILQVKDSIASSYKNLAMQERYRGNYVTALDYAIRGLKLQRNIDDKKALAKALSGAGIIYRYLGRYEKSLAHFHEAHMLYKKMNKILEIAETSKEVGLIYTRLKKFDQARSFYQLSIDLPQNKVSPKTRSAAFREIAVIDLNAGNLDSAEIAAKKAFEISRERNDKLKNSTTSRILGKINQAKGNESLAIAYYRKALFYAKEGGGGKDEIKALETLGNILIDKDTEEAVKLLKESLELSNTKNINKGRLAAYQSLRLAEKSRGNLAASLNYAEKEIELSKKMHSEKEINGLIQAKSMLDSHKMEMELESLREKTELDKLEIIKKNNEIEIVSQASRISELELTKNRYATIGLIILLIVCLTLVIFISRRFIDSRKQNKELDYLATRDPLTNCYNRRVLFDLMNRDFTDISKLGEYCIIMADIDHFKAVNDNHGHSVGDEVLRGVANILQSSVRKNDIAARFGGEEFCIVLPGAPKDQAIRIADTIRQKVETSLFEGVNVTCSFGISSIRFKAKEPKDIIDQADLALYQSKNNGRNQVTLWSDSL